jgi:hypothetical protein
MEAAPWSSSISSAVSSTSAEARAEAVSASSSKEGEQLRLRQGRLGCNKKCYPPPLPPPDSKLKPAPKAPESKPFPPKPPQHPHGPPSSGQKPPGQLFGICPADLKDDYQYPHLIVPVSTAEPQKAYGTVYSPVINNKVSSIFNFDIPQSYAGKTCSLFFFFPQQKDLQTSSFKFSGEGSAAFDLVGKAEQNTTCASKPQKIKHLNDIPVKPSMTYWVSDQPCTPGTASYAISGSNGFSLEYFQDYKPSPIGLYVRAC